MGDQELGDMTSSAAIDVFEHGIELAGVNGHPPAGLVRLATREPDLVYSGYTLAILDRDGSSLNHRVVDLVDVPGPWDENDVRYCLRSCLYHLNCVIDLYVDNCRFFEKLHSDSKFTSGTLATVGSTSKSTHSLVLPAAFTRRSERCSASITRFRGEWTAGGERYRRLLSRR